MIDILIKYFKHMVSQCLPENMFLHVSPLASSGILLSLSAIFIL